MSAMSTDILVIGWGLAGCVAACEALEAGKRVTLIDQEPLANLGGQAFWSFGGLFLIDSPEQRRMGIRDSLELARRDWFASAAFDRPEDDWAKRWAEAYLQFAAGEKRSWLRQHGIGLFPVVGWAERGGQAAGHGNSVPRFHITWGTGPGVVRPFTEQLQRAVEDGRLVIAERHRVSELLTANGRVTGAQGQLLAPDAAGRGQLSNREVIGEFSITAEATIVTSGGIGGNHELVRQQWPARLGTPPQRMITGVPAYVDGSMQAIAQAAGARLVNQDRMWHYVEGIRNHDPIWPNHAIRILPGPSSLWLDATGKRLPAPLFPGFDTTATLQYLRQQGHDYSWFITTRAIVEKEFALSGSEQNPDLTERSIRKLVSERLSKGPTPAVQAFLDRGEDFVTAATLDELLPKMQALDTDGVFEPERARAEVQARDAELDNRFSKDLQLSYVHATRAYRGDRLLRAAKPHRLTDPAAGPMVGVRLWTLTRKSLGGIQTNLDGQALDEQGTPIAGLYAAGEASGFGGGGMHGYEALEGTFLGGCLFSGRQAGRAAARALG